MGKKFRKGILVLSLIAMTALIFTGCGKTTTPAPTPVTPAVAATYAGDDTCKACHAEKLTDYHTTKHSMAFKPLSSYQTVDPLGTIKVFDSANKETATSAQIDLTKEGNVLGVMVDDYLVAAVPGFKEKYYRIAAIEKEGDKYKLKAASTVTDADKKPVDSDADGVPDWSASTYTCGSCHSPGVEVNSPSKGISCESCHGAGSDHVSAAPEKKITTIKVPDSENCLTCHKSDPAKNATTGVVTTNNHYGTRNYSASVHSSSSQVNNCLACHGVHKANAAGQLLNKETPAAVCMTCHADKKYDPSKIMWKNPTDERGHITADHSFGIKYEDLGDDPATKTTEITTPATLELLKKAVPSLSK